MSKINELKNRAKSLCNKYDKLISGTVLYYTAKLEDITHMLDLQNKVASLSNSSIAKCLMDTLKQMAYMRAEPNTEFICMYLEKAIEDLLSGMDAVDMLHKYDLMFYEMQNHKYDNQQLRGHRANCYIIDDAMLDDIKEGIGKNMVKMICDRCGKEIEGTTYYVVRIYGKDINPQSEYITTYASAVQNAATNSLAMFNAEKHYCEKCKNEIEDFIKKHLKT